MIGSQTIACLTASIRISPRAIAGVILNAGRKSVFFYFPIRALVTADKLPLFCLYYTDNMLIKRRDDWSRREWADTDLSAGRRPTLQPATQNRLPPFPGRQCGGRRAGARPLNEVIADLGQSVS